MDPQQARNLLMDPGERAGQFRFLIRDRDITFTAALGDVLADDNTRIVNTPTRSPRANPCAERFAGTRRRQCPDHLLINGQRHLRRILAEHARHSTNIIPTRRRNNDLRCTSPVTWSTSPPASCTPASSTA
jgi:putative transposase